VNGAAVTGGLELALACDFLVASDLATFADTHARVGVMPGWGLTVALPEAVGLRRAREMNATGNFISARIALAWGLVNRVVPHEQLLGFSRGLAADVASADPDALRAILLPTGRAPWPPAGRRGRSRLALTGAFTPGQRFRTGCQPPRHRDRAGSRAAGMSRRVLVRLWPAPE